MTKNKGGRPAKPPDKKARMISLKLPPDLIEAIKSRADEDELNRTQLIIRTVREYLARRS